MTLAVPGTYSVTLLLFSQCDDYEPKEAGLVESKPDQIVTLAHGRQGQSISVIAAKHSMYFPV